MRSQTPKHFKATRASSRLPIGEVVRPLDTTRKSSSTTSDKIKLFTGLGVAYCKNPPPFSKETCWRIRFIVLISAPADNKTEFNSIFSLKEIPSGGAGSNADPPPDIKHSIGRQTFDARCKAAMTAAPAIKPI